MGKRLVIKGATFTNYVDVETVYQEITYNHGDFVKLTNNGENPTGGMGTLSTKYFTNIAANNQNGAMFPIDVQGATSIKIYNSYGQSVGLHAKFLDADGEWLSDVTGTTSGYDALLAPTIPVGAKWLAVNAYDAQDHYIQVDVAGYLAPTAMTNLTFTDAATESFLKADGTITASSTQVYSQTRNVGEVSLSGLAGKKLYAFGPLGANGGQALCLGVFLNSNGEVISAISGTGDTNLVAFLIAEIPTNAVKFRFNYGSKTTPIIKYSE